MLVISGELLMNYLYPGLKALLQDCEVIGMDDVVSYKGVWFNVTEPMSIISQLNSY